MKHIDPLGLAFGMCQVEPEPCSVTGSHVTQLRQQRLMGSAHAPGILGSQPCLVGAGSLPAPWVSESLPGIHAHFSALTRTWLDTQWGTPACLRTFVHIPSSPLCCELWGAHLHGDSLPPAHPPGCDDPSLHHSVDAPRPLGRELQAAQGSTHQLLVSRGPLPSAA